MTDSRLTVVLILMIATGMAGGMLALTTRVSSVCPDNPIGPLFTGHFYLIGVDHDNMISAIYMRGVTGLVLALD